MKKLTFILTIAIALISCNGNNNNGYNQSQVVVQPYQPSQVSVTPEVANLGENLNLQALGELVKNSTTAQDIEDKLNTSGSINNLDLDGNGDIDYIKVTEYGDGQQKGFSFTVDVANGQTQEIATIEVNKGSNDAQMHIQGNHELYGNNNYYHSSFTLSDLLIMHYLFTPHRPYYSPYHYGYYPRYYHSSRSVPVSSYRTRMVNTTRTTTIRRTTRPSITSRSISPNANKSASSVTARAKTLSRPTHSQKAFTTTSASRQRPTTSGFKNSNSTPSRSSNSWGSSNNSRKSSWGSNSSSRRNSSSSRSSRSSRSSSRRR